MKIVKSIISRHLAIALELAQIDMVAAIGNNYFGNAQSALYLKDELGELMGKFQGDRLEFHLNELENEATLTKQECFFASTPELKAILNKRLTSQSLLTWVMEKPVESLASGFLSIEILEVDAKPGDYVLGCTFSFAAAFTELFEKQGFSEDFLALYKKARQFHLTKMSDSANRGKAINEIFHIQDERKFSHNIFLVVHMLLSELESGLSKKTISKLIQINILEFHKIPASN